MNFLKNVSELIRFKLDGYTTNKISVFLAALINHIFIGIKVLN